MQLPLQVVLGLQSLQVGQHGCLVGGRVLRQLGQLVQLFLNHGCLRLLPLRQLHAQSGVEELAQGRDLVEHFGGLWLLSRARQLRLLLVQLVRQVLQLSFRAFQPSKEGVPGLLLGPDVRVRVVVTVHKLPQVAGIHACGRLPGVLGDSEVLVCLLSLHVVVPDEVGVLVALGGRGEAVLRCAVLDEVLDRLLQILLAGESGRVQGVELQDLVPAMD